jgi:hypothetical protein
MVGWVRVRSPAVLESKLLCLSLLYLLTTLPLALYVSFSDPGRRCLRLLPIPSRAKTTAAALFEYPPGYGENKHALPVPRALCDTPAAFAGPSLVSPSSSWTSCNRRASSFSVLMCRRTVCLAIR